MNEFPLVTIVTLTYRNFGEIYRTIQSVLEQTYPNIQYIVSDDGSMDFPFEAIDKFIKDNKKDNIVSYRIIAHKKNLGTVKNINFAYGKADGEYLIPLSVGDEFTSSDVVDKIIRVFLERNVEVVCTSRIAVNDNYFPLFYYPHILFRNRSNSLRTSRQQYRAFILERQYGFASGSATYIKKDLWMKMHGFDEKYRLWEDGPFYAKYTSQGGVIEFAIDIISIKYKLGGVSNGGTNKLLLDDMKLFNEEHRTSVADFSFLDRRWIGYIKERCYSIINNTRNKAGLAPDILFRRMCNKFIEKVAEKIDRRNLQCK